MDKAIYHLQRAHQLFELERYENCYREARSVLQHDAKNEDAFFIMILALVQLEKYEDAEALGQNSLASYPNSAQLHYAMGVLFNHQQDYGSARQHLEDAIRINPDNSYYFFQLAKSHANFGQVQQAERLLNRSLHLDPNNDSALQLKSLIEQKTSTLQQAHLTADKALKLSPEDAHAHLVKATLSWQHKKFAEAESHLSKAVSLKPQHQEMAALWLESKTRTAPPFDVFINLLMGSSHNLVRPTLLLGALTFLPSVLLSNNFQLPFILWAGVGFLFTPLLIFWWVRPILKFNFLNKKFSTLVFTLANPSLPIETMATFNILNSVLYWTTGNGIFFGMAFLSTLVGGGMAQLKNMESYYPVYKKPILVSGLAVLAVSLIALFSFMLEEFGKG